MSTIRLSCPHCETDLELDAAFAGAIARCGQCQAMISIPAEPTPSDDDAPPPTQPSARRRSTPWLIAGVLTGLSAALVVAVGVFVLLTHDDPNRIDAGEAMVDTVGYDPSVNPFTLGTPNALGVPLRRGALIVLDTSASADPWLAPTWQQLSLSGTGDLKSLLVATEAGPREASEIAALSGGGGLADAQAAAEEVARRDPSMVVWITSEPLNHRAVELLRRLEVPIGVITIDRRDDEAEALADATQGRYVELDSGQILDWHRAATR
ncbi:MAG: hypothetical protein AAGK09_08875 [Planctomycetota bacterium]